MFLFIKKLFRKKRIYQCAESQDVWGNDVMLCKNNILASRPPTKKDWNFREGTKWVYKKKQYVMRHKWELSMENIKPSSEKPKNLDKRW